MYQKKQQDYERGTPNSSYRGLLMACFLGADKTAEAVLKRLHTLTKSFDGRVGIGVQDRHGVISVNGNQRFSLQSVMKLFVAAAVMDAVDRRGWHLNDHILVRQKDLSLSVQPLAARVGPKGYSTTVSDLLFRAIVDSDSAATDVLFARVGGAAAISQYLKRTGTSGVRVDRDERHLQTETVGLQWRPEFVDAKRLKQAEKNVPRKTREAAFRAYLRDVRDTATPEGTTAFLYRLASGKVLSPASTRHLLGVMRQTATGPDRLKAGTPAGWTLAHKTGTSGTWEGLNGTTNDAGILTSPDKRVIAVSVFVSESRRTDSERAALIAEVARIVTSGRAA